MNDDYVYLAVALFPFINLTIFALLVVMGPPSWSPFFLTAARSRCHLVLKASPRSARMECTTTDEMLVRSPRCPRKRAKGKTTCGWCRYSCGPS